jgi:ketosteroid isomerase-like protein
MAKQKYVITHELAEGERVALEVEWTGTLAFPFGALPAGSQMKAYFAMFLEFREGKIVEQRNCDCFEKW